jgi:SAM-dependent methyltransferase
MARLNRGAYQWVVAQLRAANPQSLLEIGFGTGHMLALSIRTLGLKSVAGVDPSDLMVEAAEKRLRRFRKKASLDIRRGDDTALPDGPFDAIVALHSFQFWGDPDATLVRIRERLAPGGKLILVLRAHGKRPPKWLPNPISRAGNEIAATCAALGRAGFSVVGMQGISTSSQGIVAIPA